MLCFSLFKILLEAFTRNGELVSLQVLSVVQEWARQRNSQNFSQTGYDERFDLPRPEEEGSGSLPSVAT